MRQKIKKPSAATEGSKNEIKSDKLIYAPRNAMQGQHRIEYYPNDCTDEMDQYIAYDGTHKIESLLGVSMKFTAAINESGYGPFNVRVTKDSSPEDKAKAKMYRNVYNFVKKYPFDNFLAYQYAGALHIICVNDNNACRPCVLIVEGDKLTKVFGSYKKDNTPVLMKQNKVVQVDGKLAKEKVDVKLCSYKEIWNFYSRGSYTKVAGQRNEVPKMYSEEDRKELITRANTKITQLENVIEGKNDIIEALRMQLLNAGIVPCM